MRPLLFFLLCASLLASSPGFGQVPAFSVNKNGTNQTVSTGVLTKLTWPNEVFDTNNNFASDRFTPTVAGKYLISAAVYCTDATSGCSVWVRKNGSDLFTGYQGNASTSSGGIINAVAVVDMNGSSDYVEAFIITSGTTVSGSIYHSYFTGSLLDGGGGGSGTVNSGTQYQMGYYAATGTAISGHSSIATDASNNLLITGGSVGIGTASPGSALDVKGTLRLSGSSSGFVGLAPAAAAGSTTYTLPTADGTNGQFLRTNGSGTLSWATPSGGGGQWSTSGSDIYYDSGRVGIGTDDPATTAQLDVNGRIRASDDGAGAVEIFYTAGSDNAGTIRGYDSMTTQERPLKVYGTPLLLNGDTSDVVGIGTTSSSAKVSIHASAGVGLYVNRNVGIGTTSVDGYFLNVQANEPTLLSVTRDASSNGFTIPISLRALNTSSARKEYARIEAQIGSGTAGSEQGILGFHTITGGTLTEKARIDASGNVGIGTNSPRGGSKLDVNGTLYVGSFAGTTSTAVCQNGNVLSTCSSARRYKERIKPSRLGLKEVLEMKPVTFDFKDHKDNWEKHDFGFVAEDMEKINPLFVTYDGKGSIEGVRYTQLTAVNARAIQELHALIATQQAEIDGLKKALAAQPGARAGNDRLQKPKD